MNDYLVRPLMADRWDGFAEMVERHNGVFGGCWCTYFHTMSAEKERTYNANRSLKQTSGRRGPGTRGAGVRRRRGGRLV